MDVNNNLNNSIMSTRPSDPSAKPQTNAESGVETPVAGGEDKVTLTGGLGQVKDLQEKASAMPIDNAQRISELKSAIADGSYQVNAESVASKLMQTETMMSKG
ncbi:MULTISPECIES: flagellar biosynthesis anti-sigma factor FlgM [Thiomicrorhabdus]|uniref:Negative regulator of flagellin synthesis n=1 Tax=Thiomicrorhabdus heinhorstiae TaxID=2748010 RepID=A0ABS0BZ24_9GAMM|nr:MULTISPECIES: flagellar biosynthesis anti-sigma factor FlgM [Thiomicrorhabdus]MBF6058689.1 flagellar biosynthesis anti-sigma factor FlgM [Thiomicrorhabdus heinhorstiae]